MSDEKEVVVPAEVKVSKPAKVTLEDRVTAIEKRFNAIAAQLRQHFGMKDGFSKLQVMGLTCVFCVMALTVYAATTTVWDIGNLASGTIGTCKVTSDGTNATLTVNNAVFSNVVFQGTVTGSGMTNVVDPSIIAAGVMANTMTISNNASILVVSNETVKGTLSVTKALSASGGLVVTGEQTNSATLTVTGIATFSATNTAVNGRLTLAHVTYPTGGATSGLPVGTVYITNLNGTNILAIVP